MSLEAKSKTPNQIISEIDRPLKLAKKWVPLNDAVKVIEANHKNWALMFADQEKRHDVRAKYIAQLEIDIEKAKNNIEEILWLRHYSDPQTPSDVDKEVARIDALENELIKICNITFERFQSNANQQKAKE